MTRRLDTMLLAALLAWCIGKALGVPIWRGWNTGDRTDLAMLAAALVWVLTA